RPAALSASTNFASPSVGKHWRLTAAMSAMSQASLDRMIDVDTIQLCDLGFDLRDDRVERCRVEDRQLGERFAVELDLGFVEAADELAVADAAFASGRVDADDPQLAELALAAASVAEGERLGPHQVFFDRAEQPA